MRTLSSIVMLLAFGSVPLFAQNDDLQEATGLEQKPETIERNPEEASLSTAALRWRAYALLEQSWLKNLSKKSVQKQGVSGEVSATVDASLDPRFSVFGDGRLRYVEDGKPETSGYLNQLGLRVRPHDQLLVVLGKERNRRAPGLIVSPSDFLHSNQSLPGTRENRCGVWLARVAWQNEQHNLELIGLPFSRENDQGFPAESGEYKGTVGRYFGRFEGLFDVGLDYGHFQSTDKIGAALQTILFKTWKLYGEQGYETLSDTKSSLLGVSYEVFSDTSLHAEWYHSAALPSAVSLFSKDQSYVILSARCSDILHRFNLTPTFIKNLETAQYITLFRGEYVATDHQVLGFTYLRLNPERPLSWQVNIDWQYNL